MQQPNAGSTRSRSGEGLCPCASCNWLLHPAPTNAQEGLDPQQLALVVFFLPPNSAKPHLHLQWAFPATCAVFFFLPTSTFTNVHTYTSTFCNLHYVVVVVIVCGSDFMCSHLLSLVCVWCVCVCVCACVCVCVAVCVCGAV